MPVDILALVHELVVLDWHESHEDMVGLLQAHADESSVPILRQAIALKPSLAHLEHDDYGSYYKKCLHALKAIGTADARAAIAECAESGDPVLKQQAEYRLARLEGAS